MSQEQSPVLPAEVARQLCQLATQSPAYAKRCRGLINSLNQGVPYTRLGGQYLRRQPSLIRFKIGKNHRLLVRKSPQGWLPKALLSRQQYDYVLKRRC